jgi:hypothetical protein
VGDPAAKKVIAANMALAVFLALLLLWNIRALSPKPSEREQFKNTVFSLPERRAPERLAALKQLFGPEPVASKGGAGSGGEEGSTQELKIANYSVRLEGTILARGRRIGVFILLPRQEKGKKSAKELRLKVGEGGELFDAIVEKIESHHVFLRSRTSGDTVKLSIFKNDSAEI